MNENLRNIYVKTVQSKRHNSNKTWAYDFDEDYAAKFAELIIEDIDKIINDLYHALPLEKAAVLLTLDEQIKEHFYANDIQA